MNLEFDAAKESGDDARDRAPLLWIGIIGMVALMLGALYMMTRRDNTTETRANVKHILFRYDALDDADRERALAKAQEVRQTILDGMRFEAAAEQFSEDEMTNHRGGDLGRIPRNVLTQPVDLYVWQAPLDQVSEPIHTEYGYHLVMVASRTISDFDKYEQTIRDRAYGNAARTAPAGEQPAEP